MFLHRLFDTNRLHCTSLQKIVDTKEFNVWVCFMIVSNAAFIGITSDMLIKKSIDAHENGGVVSMNGNTLVFFEIFFNATFAVELLLRLVAHEGRFCVGPGGRWNMFDAVLVISSCVDMFLAAVNVTFTLVRVLRLFRIVRTLRVVKLLRFAGTKTLRLMVLAIIQSTMPLLIASLILVILMFLFGVTVLNGVADLHCGSELWRSAC